MPKAKYPLVHPRLQARIAELDRPLAEVALRAGCAAASITHVVRGRLRPSDALKVRLAEALESTVAELFEEAA